MYMVQDVEPRADLQCSSHLRLDLLLQRLERVHVWLELGPADAEALLLVWLRDLSLG